VVRPNKKDYPLDKEIYLLMLETYADHLEEDINDLRKASDDASWALEEYQQPKRDNFGDEYR
jgi:hypothetical protein